MERIPTLRPAFIKGMQSKEDIQLGAALKVHKFSRQILSKAREPHSERMIRHPKLIHNKMSDHFLKIYNRPTNHNHVYLDMNDKKRK